MLGTDEATPKGVPVSDSLMPDDLGTAGQRAFKMAARHVESLPDPDKFADAVLRFARAIDMVEEVRAEWISYGRPKLFTHTNGAVVPHPLVKLMAESEKDAARAGRALKLEPEALKNPRGGVKGRAVAPDRKPPPIVKLSTKKLET
jgi:hypothetical protein